MKYRFLFWTFNFFFFFEKRPFMARQFYYTLPFSAAICSSTMYDYIPTWVPLATRFLS